MKQGFGRHHFNFPRTTCTLTLREENLKRSVTILRYDYLTQVIADEQLHLVFEKATALVEHMSVSGECMVHAAR
ncbi:hypothetical protein E2C01_077072 [Portunus trituberculatus]|uniref:Uncharacterized protein n=1 Tax=Portunus trituberculatus TaxID=210409 RepID=A0A5B7IJA0_PORTR|nr:hypothetical protein [Portunus trituberculatus]